MRQTQTLRIVLPATGSAPSRLAQVIICIESHGTTVEITGTVKSPLFPSGVVVAIAHNRIFGTWTSGTSIALPVCIEEAALCTLCMRKVFEAAKRMGAPIPENTL